MNFLHLVTVKPLPIGPTKALHRQVTLTRL